MRSRQYQYSVEAGQLRHQVTIEAEQRTADGYGGYAPPAWVPVATVFASIEPLSGAEAVANRQLQDRVTHKISIRYTPGIKAAMRVRFGERLFNIREVRNVEERNWRIELRAEENVAI